MLWTLRRSQKIEILAEIPLLSLLSKRELSEIAGRAEVVQVEANDKIVSQGERADACYVVVDGTAVVRKNGRVVAELGEGEVIGELSLIDGAASTGTVVMTTAGALLQVTRRAFGLVAFSAPSTASKVMGQLAWRVRSLDRDICG